MASDSIIPLLLLPDELITEILLKLPVKSLSKFMCVSKSWLQLISSPTFVKNHIKLTADDKGYIHHRLIFRNIDGNFKFCSLPPLFTKQQHTEELFHIDSPIERSTLSTHIVGSVNGLICVVHGQKEAYIWNPTITKSKELPKFTSNMCSSSIKYGFGYDESRDDYKVVFIHYPYNHSSSSNMTTVVYIYSLRNNSWTTFRDQLQCFLVNHYGRFVSGKLYWTSSTCINKYKVCKITSFDLADGTWGSLELPICGKDNFDINLGVVGSDLSLLYTCQRGAATSDVWIMKHSGVNVSWTKLFTIKYPQNIKTHRCFAPVFTFSIHFRHGEILLLLCSAIMIYDGSTRQLKHTSDVMQCEEIYVESLVNPLTISDQGRRNQESPQSSHS
ncbi:F-box/kelch-repeat protein At3g23880-like [Solanum stenotomum]|uniref:F-box/kelch-repeat protein At3g23880-like n=1 Tax=Solanum stenotomum TaxID=172797 RepID=UPI0020D029F6|nr:F-box/kelch-repeat protein At3g23880-like [Solanum stenotomum]